MAGDFSGPPVPLEVTVCASPSWLVQVTLVPTLTVRFAGLNANFAMATAFPATGAASLAEPVALGMSGMDALETGLWPGLLLADGGLPHAASTIPATDR